MKQHAQTVEKNVKFLSNQTQVNRFTVEIATKSLNFFYFY